jgi:hypothetical protein
MSSMAMLALPQCRQDILRNHGLLAIRLPPTRYAQQGEFTWLAEPDISDPRADQATWYCDGSMLHGKWKPLRVTGFGIAVVSQEGDLLAYGLGWPPTWCAIAAAAEVWALQVVLENCPFPPQMRTDCMAILTTARGGSARLPTTPGHSQGYGSVSPRYWEWTLPRYS